MWRVFHIFQTKTSKKAQKPLKMAPKRAPKTHKKTEKKQAEKNMFFLAATKPDLARTGSAFNFNRYQSKSMSAPDRTRVLQQRSRTDGMKE